MDFLELKFWHQHFRLGQWVEFDSRRRGLHVRSRLRKIVVDYMQFDTYKNTNKSKHHVSTVLKAKYVNKHKDTVDNNNN